jgi:hypothetical protein
MVRTLGRVIDEVAARNVELSSRMTEAKTAAENLADTFSQGIADGGNFAQAVSQITGEMNAMGSAARTAGQAVDWLIGIWNRGRNGPGWTAALGGGLLTWGANVATSFTGEGAAQAAAAEQAGFASWAARQRQNERERRSAELDAELGEWLDMNAGISQGRSGGGSLYNAPTGPRRRSGGGGGAARFDEFGPFESDLSEAIRQQSEMWARLNTQRREQEAEIARVQMEAGEAQAERIQEQKDLEEQAHQRRLEFVAEEKAQQQALRDYTREQVMGSINAFAQIAQVGSGIFSQLATQQQQQISNIESVLRASGASQKAIEQATKAQQDRLDRIKKAEGGFLIAYNTVMAATATAQAVFSGAKQDYAAMAGYIAAAAGYAAAAAMAGVKLGDDGSGGGGSASAAPAGAPSYSPRAAATGPSENTSTNVTIFTWGYSNSGLGRQVERARMEYSRSGGDADMIPAGGYDQ